MKGKGKYVVLILYVFLIPSLLFSLKSEQQIFRRVKESYILCDLLNWKPQDLNAVQGYTGGQLINLIAPNGEVLRPTDDSSRLEPSQIAPLSAWDVIFTQLIPQIDPNAQEVQIVLHRGELGDKMLSFWVPGDFQSLTEEQKDKIAWYAAVTLNNALTSLGAESVTITNKEIAKRVRELYDPYYNKKEIELKITLQNGNEIPLKVAIPQEIQEFNSSDNQAEAYDGEIANFAEEIGKAVKDWMDKENVDIDDIQKILVPCDRHTYVKLALEEKKFAQVFGIDPAKDKELANKYTSKLRRFPFFDNQAGTMQDIFAWGKGEKFEINEQLSPHGVNIVQAQPRAPPQFNFDPFKGRLIGIDLGGGSVKIAIVESGQVKKCEEIKDIWERIKKEKTMDRAIEIILANIKSLGIDLDTVDAVGISWAGPVGENKVLGTSRLRFNMGKTPLNDLRDFAQRLQEKLKSEGLSSFTPVVIINDGDAGGFYAYVENYVKKHQPQGVVTFLGLGTGFAFTRIENGYFSKGVNEWGRSEVDMARNFVQKYTTHALTTGYLSGGGVVKVANELGLKVKDASEVDELFKQGDEKARQVAERIGEYLAETLCQLQKFYGDLGVILLGGGVMQGDIGKAIKQHAEQILRGRYNLDINLKIVPDPQFAVAEGAAQYANMTIQRLIEDCEAKDLEVIPSGDKARDVFTPSQLLQISQIIRKENKKPVKIEVEINIAGWREMPRFKVDPEYEPDSIEIRVFLLFEDGTRRVIGATIEEIDGESYDKKLRRIEFRI